MFFWKKKEKLIPIDDMPSLPKSETFCIMPWVHFHVTQYGTVTPCCQAPWQEEYSFGNINKQSIKEIWNGDKIKVFRKNILDGKIDKRCVSCFKREKDGFTSLRKITNNKYKHKYNLELSNYSIGETANTLPVYFDIRFSNTCNLKCRICGPWSSSSWFNDVVKLGMISENANVLTYSFEYTNLFFEQFKEMIPNLEELYFAGGEPLVMDEHYQILNLLIENKKTDVRLTYNTNFSIFNYKSYNLFDLWKNFKNISLAASLDASGKRGEFLRKNLNWNTVIENREYLQAELPHVEFIVSSTINIYHLLHLPDFHKEWVDQNLIRVEDFIPTLLVQPNELSISILPNTFKLKAYKKYSTHYEWISKQPFLNAEKHTYMLSQFQNILKVLNVNTAINSLDLFRRNSAAMDEIRKEKTTDVFPELTELF